MTPAQERILPYAKRGALLGFCVFLLVVILIALFSPHPFISNARAVLSSWLVPTEIALLLRLLVQNIILPHISTVEPLTVAVINPLEIIFATVKQVLVYVLLGAAISWFINKRRVTSE